MAIKKKFFNLELNSTTEMNLSAFQNKYRISVAIIWQNFGKQNTGLQNILDEKEAK